VEAPRGAFPETGWCRADPEFTEVKRTAVRFCSTSVRIGARTTAKASPLGGIQLEVVASRSDRAILGAGPEEGEAVEQLQEPRRIPSSLEANCPDRQRLLITKAHDVIAARQRERLGSLLAQPRVLLVSCESKEGARAGDVSLASDTGEVARRRHVPGIRPQLEKRVEVQASTFPAPAAIASPSSRPPWFATAARAPSTSSTLSTSKSCSNRSGKHGWNLDTRLRTAP